MIVLQKNYWQHKTYSVYVQKFMLFPKNNDLYEQLQIGENNGVGWPI